MDDLIGVEEQLEEDVRAMVAEIVCIKGNSYKSILLCKMKVRGSYYVSINKVGEGARWRRETGQEIYSPLLMAFTHENKEKWKASNYVKGYAMDLFKAKIEAAMEEARSQQAASLTEFNWLGYRFPVSNPKSLTENVADLSDLISFGRDRKPKEIVFEEECQRKSLAFRAERCFYLAKSYSVAGKRVEAYALYCRGRSLAEDALDKFQSIANKYEGIIQELKTQSKECRACDWDYGRREMSRESVKQNLNYLTKRFIH